MKYVFTTAIAFIVMIILIEAMKTSEIVKAIVFIVFIIGSVYVLIESIREEIREARK